MTKARDSVFYDLEEAMEILKLDEARLRRLVAEREIRAFRKFGEMVFKRNEIDSLAGRSSPRPEVCDTEPAEVSLEEYDDLSAGHHPFEDTLEEFISEGASPKGISLGTFLSCYGMAKICFEGGEIKAYNLRGYEILFSLPER